MLLSQMKVKKKKKKLPTQDPVLKDKGGEESLLVGEFINHHLSFQKY